MDFWPSLQNASRSSILQVSGVFVLSHTAVKRHGTFVRDALAKEQVLNLCLGEAERKHGFKGNGWDWVRQKWKALQSLVRSYNFTVISPPKWVLIGMKPVPPWPNAVPGLGRIVFHTNHG